MAIGDYVSLLTYCSLTKRIYASPDHPSYPAYFLEITAYDQDGLHAAVFVYRREVIDETQTDPDLRDRAFFTNITSEHEWNDLPIGIPISEDVREFRHHQIQVFCASLAEADYIWKEIIADVTVLTKHFQKVDDLLNSSSDVDETVIIGYPTDNGDSSSS